MKCTILTLCLFLSLAAAAQQDILSTMYMNVLEYYNPAAAGVDYRHKAILQYRNQWDKVNGAPNSLTAVYSARLDSINSALGFAGHFDAIGFNRQLSGHVNYAYHFHLGESTLSAGAQLGVISFGISPDWVPPVSANDPALPDSRYVSAFDCGAGLYFRRRSLFGGAGMKHINRPAFSFNKEVSYNTARHSFLNAGYEFYLNRNFTLVPSVLGMTDFKELSATFMLEGVLFRNIRAAVQYRTSDSAAALLMWDIAGKFRIGYAYDLTLNALSGISRGSHEIAAGFLLR
jgi:type IX secretion system PorP/SprF family membrane protein